MGQRALSEQAVIVLERASGNVVFHNLEGKMLTKFQRLHENLKRDYPDVHAELTVFPSGAAMLDLKIGSEPYVFECLPKQNGFGLSRRATAVFGWEGVDQFFDSFEEAESCLLPMLGEVNN